MRCPILALVVEKDVAERARRLARGPKVRMWSGAVELGFEAIRPFVGVEFDHWYAIRRGADDAQYGMAPLRKTCARALGEIGDWTDDELPCGVLVAAKWRPHFLGPHTGDRKKWQRLVQATLRRYRETHWAVGYIIHF